MDCGTSVQVLEEKTGRWKSGTVLEHSPSANKALVAIAGKHSTTKTWLKIGNIRDEVQEVLSEFSDTEFAEFCDRAFHDRQNCTPGVRQKTSLLPVQQLTVTLLEIFDRDHIVSHELRKRMQEQHITFNGESFLRTMEMLIIEIEKRWSKKGFLREPREERLLARRSSVGALSWTECRLLTRGDQVKYNNGDKGQCRSLVTANDTFSCFVHLENEQLICYEALRKVVHDEEVYHLQISDIESDDSTQDPTWESPTPCKPMHLEPLIRKRSRPNNIRSIPQAKRPRTANAFQIIARGKPGLPISPPSSEPSSSHTTPTRSDFEYRRDEELEQLKQRVEILEKELHELKSTVFNKGPNSETDVAPTRQARSQATITNPDFWKLRPVDVPIAVTDENISQVIRTRSHNNPIEEAKRKASASRAAFTRDLFSTFFSLEEIYNRNVNGVVKSKTCAPKLALDKNKVREILSTVNAAFPGKSSDYSKDIITTMNDFNRAIWNKKFKNVTLPPFPA